VRRSIRIYASEGSKQYELSFEDDDTAVDLDFELSTANPTRRMRLRAPRAAIMRKVITGNEDEIDRLVREFLSGAPT